MVVVAVSHEALGCSVPPGADVLGVGLLGIGAYISAAGTFAGTEVGELDVISLDQYVLGFDVAVEDALLVDVLNGFQQLVHVTFDFLWS